MTDRQIYKRMNECYTTEYGDDYDDEWYGSNNPTEWKFYRPSKDLTVLMNMDIENKRIKMQEKKKGEDYKTVGYYKW